jgi:hypothetical protein
MKATAIELLEANPTTPAINLLKDATYRKRYVHYYMKLSDDIHKLGVKNLIEFFKEKLGKQSYCWVGSHKNWIWEFDNENLFMRVFVNNTQGISIEFLPNASETDVFTGIGFLAGQLLK